ncbi:uncharacterized, partial [Tachysurus ichikawai]
PFCEALCLAKPLPRAMQVIAEVSCLALYLGLDVAGASVGDELVVKM